MARRYVNPSRGETAAAPRIQRLGGRADLEALMARDPGPWTLVKTAELQDLLGRAEGVGGSAIEMNWPELAAVLRGGLR